MRTEEAITSAPLLGEPLPVELMNTIWADRNGVYDALSEPEQAWAWLRATADRAHPALPADPPGRDALRRAARRLRTLRDAVRRLAAERTEDPRPSADIDLAAAITVLNEANAAAPGWSELSWPAGGEPRRDRRSAANPVEFAVAELAGQAVELFTGAQRAELRACLAPGCVLYFVREHPRRQWCSSGCGNRARVARHYQRHHAQEN